MWLFSRKRINPGDKKNQLTNIKKITSGSNKEVADFIDKIYLKIINAGTYKASSIMVAEAAKVIGIYTKRCEHCLSQ